MADLREYKQFVRTAPARIFVEKYLTKKGKRLIAEAKTKAEKQLVWDKYGKNGYRNNPESHLFRNPNGKVRIIKHT